MGPILVNPILPSGVVRISNPTDGAQIGTISLNGGSIISSSVTLGGNFNDWQPVRGVITVPSLLDNPTNPRFDIASIKITNGGGIIGSAIVGPDIGPIKIEGFGFINSFIGSTGQGVVAGIDTTGYGIRGSLINETLNVNSLVARGSGSLVDAKSFSGSVAYSTKKKVDPFFGVAPNADTDIYRALGLGTNSSIKKTISASGVIENTTANGAGTLGNVQAYQLRGLNGGTDQLSFADGIGTIGVLDGTDQLFISSGGLKSFTTGSDVANTELSVSGPIQTVNIGGTMRGTSSVNATGPDGSLSTLTTKHALFANVHADVGIGSIVVGTDLGSSNVSTINNIDLLQVGGSILGSTTVANIQDKQIFSFKKLSELDVTHNIDAGATIRVKKLVKQHVGGVINGNLIVG